MRPFTILMVAIISLVIISCQPEKTLITEKIQYDVNIVSPDPDYDWWIQNLPGPQRDKLVDMIFDGVNSGKFQAYDYWDNPLTIEDVGYIRSDTIFVTLMDVEPPYAEYDSMIVRNILREDIERVRFLEEWKINPENMAMSKRILGIAPIARRIDSEGITRWQPLFWIYTDKEYIKLLEK